MKGFRKDGSVDLRRLPLIVERPLMRHVADGLATQLLHTEPHEAPPDQPILEIDSRLVGRVRLETIIHEALHLACPWMMEPVVLKVARYIAMIVWHLEYRREDEETGRHD
jgi:hypothetical protein